MTHFNQEQDNDDKQIMLETTKGIGIRDPEVSQGRHKKFQAIRKNL
jgi:hypothetical protein